MVRVRVDGLSATACGLVRSCGEIN